MCKEESVWNLLNEEKRNIASEFSSDYIDFLSSAKTERETLEYLLTEASKQGFVPLEKYSELKTGDKVSYIFHRKALCLAVIGTKTLGQGMRLIGSHLDAPRLDLKQKPLYQESGLGLAKTHYYGGIKNYHWTAIPLAIHGVVVTEDGKSINVAIGENESDPVFTITDLLPHLAKEQMDKKVKEAIRGEGLNILLAGTPTGTPTGTPNNSATEEKDRVKKNILGLLDEAYGIKEEDLISAELEVVPAGRARKVGIDKAFVGGYGQDDRICVYTSFWALLAQNAPEHTCVALFADKEETGSDGATGMKSNLLEDFVAELSVLLPESTHSILQRRALRNTKALSADVTAAFDPNFSEVYDKSNSAFLGQGVVVSKYSGVGGKYDANDACAEYVGYIRKFLNQAGVHWQTGELGKVDQGGGGTLAQFLARYGMEIIDCGPALLSMHSPFEISSVVDIYMTYLAYKAFFAV